MSNPLVSIIVPCYKQSQYLDECLQSVLDQTYSYWECIIVNDGSPDDTADVAKRWVEKDVRFKYLFKENGGLSSARNAGLELAEGEWIQFLDCDDLIEIEKISFAANFFKEEIDIIVSSYRYFFNDEGINFPRIYGQNFFLPEVCIYKDDFIDKKILFRNKNPFVISAPLYKRTVFDIVGVFDTRLKALEDWEFNLRCAFKDMIFHHIGYSQNSKTLIRIHNQSMMRNQKLMSSNLIRFNELVNQNNDVINYLGVTTVRSNKIWLKLKEVILLILPPLFIYLFKFLFQKRQINR